METNEERVAALAEIVEAAEDMARALSQIDEGLNDLLSMSQGLETESIDIGMSFYAIDPYSYYEETRVGRAVAENLKNRMRMVTADLTNNKATMDSRKADAARIVENAKALIERLSA